MVWKIFSEKATMFDLKQLREELFSEEYYGTVIDQLNGIRQVHDHMAKVAVERTTQIQALSSKISELEKKGAPAELSALVGRIEALEGRITTLHGMLTEENPVTGKKKLSPLGKRVKAFYGR